MTAGGNDSREVFDREREGPRCRATIGCIHYWAYSSVRGW